MKHPLLFAAALLAVMPADARETVGDATLELEGCRIRAGRGFPGIKARCGTFERHLNPDDRDSPLIGLFVAVVPALTLEPEPDPFVPIAGGPGQASSQFYAGLSGAFEMVRRNRDIVLLDQRGTGQSAATDCEIDEAVIEGHLPRQQIIAQTKTCLEELSHDPRFFTTSVAVRDLEALREALGYPRFNLYGVSYGTRVAQHFLRLYPESTRTVVLDGVVPPQVALGPAIAIEAQKALDAIFDRCAESPDCSRAFPEIHDEFTRLSDNLYDEPVTVMLPHPLRGIPQELSFGGQELAAAVRLLSYHPSSVAVMPMLINEAALGNFAPLASQYLMISERASDAINIAMHNSVVCTEDVPFFDGTDIDRDALDDTYMGPVLLDALEAICSVWPAGVMDDKFRTPLASDVPVLLLSGEADPITPPHYAELAAVDLGNARLITGPKQGHGMAARGCMPHVIAEFVQMADAEALDIGCLDRLFAMPFFLDFSGPTE